MIKKVQRRKPASKRKTSKSFDASTLSRLQTTEEIRIVTTPPGSKAKHRATIWVVVVDGTVFIRSFLGKKGNWYQHIVVTSQADLEFSGKRAHAKAIRVKDQKTIAAVSRAYLEKYRSSPYAKDMVRPEVLPTTLRLEPA